MKTVPLKDLFGTQNESLRAELKARGGKPNSKANVWEVPDEHYTWLLEKLGKIVDVKPQPQPQPQPQPKLQVPEMKPFPTATAEAPRIPLKLVKDEEKADEAGATAGRRTLKLVPSRYAIISVETIGPRSRRNTQKDKKRTREEAGRRAGLEKETIKTESEYTIYDPDGHAAAVELQGRLGARLRRLGTRISDGVIIFPLDKEKEFDSARESCWKEEKEFNRSSTNWKVHVNAAKLAIMLSDEEQAAQRVTWEIQRVLRDLEDAIKTCDVERIRAAAVEAKAKIPAMPSGVESAALASAVAAARETANRMAKETKEKGEELVSALTTDYQVVSSARMLFSQFSIPEGLEEAPAEPSSGGMEAGRFGPAPVAVNGDDLD